MKVRFEPAGYAVCREARRVARHAGFALAASLGLALCGPSELRRLRMTGPVHAPAALVAVPSTAVDITAPPSVSSPTASAARCRVRAQPVIASAVDARRLEVVAVSQIGGLYGP